MTFFSRFRRPLTIFAGSMLTLLGLVLMPVPGPGGTPVFLAGLALLAAEFRWARRILERFKGAYGQVGKKRRAALAISMIAFYAASGFLAWNWMNRAEAQSVTEKIND